MFFCCADKGLEYGQAETVAVAPKTGKVFSDEAWNDEVRIQVFPDVEHLEDTLSTEASSTVATSSSFSDRSVHTEQFVVTICKSTADAKLGLDIVPKDGVFLKVKQVKRDGPVKAWNALHINKRVKTCDRIVEVNGVRGDTEAMLSIIATTQDIVMIIERPW